MDSSLLCFTLLYCWVLSVSLFACPFSFPTYCSHQHFRRRTLETPSKSVSTTSWPRMRMVKLAMWRFVSCQAWTRLSKWSLEWSKGQDKLTLYSSTLLLLVMFALRLFHFQRNSFLIAPSGRSPTGLHRRLMLLCHVMSCHVRIYIPVQAGQAHVTSCIASPREFTLL